MGSDWERELKEIKSRLPSPIAHAVHEVVSEGEALPRYLLLLEAIELTARFLALLAAVEIRNTGKDDPKFELLSRGVFGSTVEFLQYCSRNDFETTFGKQLATKHDLPGIRKLADLRARKKVSSLTFFESCVPRRNNDRSHGLVSEENAEIALQMTASAYVEMLGHIGLTNGLKVRFVTEIRVLSRPAEEVRFIELVGTERTLVEKIRFPSRSHFEPGHVHVQMGDLSFDLHPWMVWRDRHLYFFDAIKEGVPEYKTHSQETGKVPMKDLTDELSAVALSLFQSTLSPPSQEEPKSIAEPLSQKPSMSKITIIDPLDEDNPEVIWIENLSPEEVERREAERIARLLRFHLENSANVAPLKTLLGRRRKDGSEGMWTEMNQKHRKACAAHFLPAPLHLYVAPKPDWFPSRANETTLLTKILNDFGIEGDSWGDVLTALKDLENQYKTHRVQKSSGGIRVLHEPIGPLKDAQTRIAKILTATYSFHDAATAYVPERSHVHHALRHSGATHALKLDIKNFFDNITSRHVLRALARTPHTRSILVPMGITNAEYQFLKTHPESVPNPFYGFSEQGRLTIVKLCTRKDRLPQGAPSSPSLANLVAHTLDRNLSSLRFKGLTYTRYADDIVVSQASPQMEWDLDEILNHVKQWLQYEGWKLNAAKTDSWSAAQGSPLTICGIRVPGAHQKFPDLSRELKRNVRAALHAQNNSHGPELPVSRGMLAYAYHSTGNYAYRMAASIQTEDLVSSFGRSLGFRDEALRAFMEVWKSVRRPEAPHIGLQKS